MRNIRLLLQYEGTRYQGWQRQTSSDNTIQGKLENLLSKMCNEEIEIQASGRTDAGVHAMGQVANFHTNSQMSVEEMLEYMNQYLPEDIVVREVREAAPRFHSRLNATGKKYCYRILNSKVSNAFWRRYAVQVSEELNIIQMQKAASLLLGEHDYKSFTSNKKGKKSTVRRIDNIDITKDGDMLIFTFEGNGFLHHMVRILMGTLVEIGMGKRNPEEIPEILAAKSREQAGMLMPSKGLMLMEVYYE